MVDSTADFIIVGGGLTGCVVASLLSQSPTKPSVILIEAGPSPTSYPAASGVLSGTTLIGGDLDYSYMSEPTPSTEGRKHVLPAGKTLGGGSIINFGSWLRADAEDYNDWADLVVDRKWSYEGLKPWLCKSETCHDIHADSDSSGIRGPVQVHSVSGVEGGMCRYPLREAVKEAWLEMGSSLNLSKANGRINGLAEMRENSVDGLRQPSFSSYPLDKVQVILDTLVHKVTVANAAATGVELVGGRQLTARKEVILCGGSYRTPQTLMLSGIGPAATLREHNIPVVYDSPHVGRNLHDHFCLFLSYKLRDPQAGYALGGGGWDEPALTKFVPCDWLVSETLPEDIISKHESEKEKHGRNMWEVLTTYCPIGTPGIPIDGTHIATSTMLLRPTSRGTVSIRSANPEDTPAIQPNYMTTDLDRDTLVYATRQTLKATLTSGSLETIVESESPPVIEGVDGLTPMTTDWSDEEIEQRIRQTGSQHHHSGGTAAMGKVVDTEGRVLGIAGLRVADASIVPIPLGGHPQATLYAMAEQLVSCILS